MTAGEIKRSLHRAVQQYASEQATPLWRGNEIHAGWSERNLAAVERLAQHILDLPDDDPRFAAVATAYTGHEWRLHEPYPWNPTLDGLLTLLGGSKVSVLSDPEEFISRWSTVAIDNVRR